MRDDTSKLLDGCRAVVRNGYLPEEREVLAVLLGEDAQEISPNVLSRSKAQWAEEYQDWAGRSLVDQRCRYSRCRWQAGDGFLCSMTASSRGEPILAGRALGRNTIRTKQPIDS